MLKQNQGQDMLLKGLHLMKDKLSKFGLDIKVIKFALVGVVNTLFGSAIMFILYNCFDVNYYISSFCNYFFGSILSYFLNKYFTFNYKKKDLKTIIKFIINISVCYLISYGAIRPIIRIILEGQSIKLIDNIAMIGGMCFFIILNYFGQRFFVFREKEKN